MNRFTVVLCSFVAFGCSDDEPDPYRPSGDPGPQIPTWVFQAEDETNHGCGEIAGCDGSGADCWHVDSTLCPTGGNIAHGPYTTDIPVGTYEATWRIKADTTGLQPTDAIAMLDVFVNPNLHVERAVTAADFPTADQFVDITLTFILHTTDAVELRAWYLGTTYPELWIDRVTVRETSDLSWSFESEDEVNHGCGESATDCDGAGGGCWHADPTLCPSISNIAYGPYFDKIPYGTYEITWRIKADTTSLSPTDRLLVLSAAVHPTRYDFDVLFASDFPSADTFYDFTLTTLARAPGAWEFVTDYDSNRAPVWVDRVMVTPVAMASAWLFEAEDPVYAGHGCGNYASDCDGTGVDCWAGTGTLCTTNEGLVHGPYTYNLPIGSFVATFRIKADASGLTATDEILNIDVAVNPTVLDSSMLTAADFPSASEFYEFDLSFNVTGPATHEFRIAYGPDATPDVWIDSVVVSPAP